MRSPAVAFRLRQRAAGDDDVHVKIIPGFVELKSVGGVGWISWDITTFENFICGGVKFKVSRILANCILWDGLM